MAIGLDTSSLMALVLESILFGLLTALFAATIYILVFRRRASGMMNKPVLAVAVLMYCVAFVHVAINTRRAVIAFILLSGGREAADSYFAASDDPMYLAKVSMNMVQTLIGDSFLIYRMYMVWGRDIRLLIPAVACVLGCLAASIITLINAAQAPATTLIFVPELGASIVAFFALTLFTNLACTTLIAAKIWWTGRQLGRYTRGRNLSPVLAIVVESGSIYSAALISLIAAFLSRSWGHYIILDMVVQIIAITFSLIIVRIGLGISASNPSQKFHSSSQVRSGGPGSRRVPNPIPMQPLVVHLATTRTVNDDNGRAVSDGTAGDDDSLGITGRRSDVKQAEGDSFVDV
ncbi:uncharacterized protein FOMMEDRAFT_142685 [Fomitiporia mediterranea MF3/22]|uniref:uncharacterized protein n=1 Tax=Fomitiporia mediterranea (strain MF3/22) TaxID=694068 RepID=UPI0004409151|nr:uncharacterized protein FOMMEDRAFT_142685 [Fomitiporia mediterranea MF3/22]EJC99754.1 hypothetical protein FOMMEDRAFT_142685 [Fomitiporia mediterranea MF3/22]